MEKRTILPTSKRRLRFFSWRKFCRYLVYDKNFMVITDHKALEHMLSWRGAHGTLAPCMYFIAEYTSLLSSILKQKIVSQTF